MNNNENCVVDYIAKQAVYIQPILNQIREVILQELEGVEERISWNMPTYWDQHNIIHFAAFKKHIGLYPGPEAIVFFKEVLKDF